MFNLSAIICGVRVIVQTDNRQILSLIAPAFADHHDTNQSVESEVVYWIVASNESIAHLWPEQFLHLEQSELTDEEPYIYKRTPHGIFYKDKYASWYLQPGNCYCIFNLDFWIERGNNYHDFYYLIFRTMFYEGLWHQSRFWIHAAGIQHRTFGPFLVVGQSHHGKSTISVAFCDAGHQLLTDDTIFFTNRHTGGYEFRTLQRELQLGQDLGGKIKSLSGVESRKPYSDGDIKVAVGLREFFADRIINRMLGAKAIIFPQIVVCPVTRAIPIKRFEAFWRLLCHSYTGLLDPDSTITARFLRSLYSIVEESVSFVLLCGSDCYKDPSLYVKIIETELAKNVSF